jgi:hypothetical protein
MEEEYEVENGIIGLKKIVLSKIVPKVKNDNDLRDVFLFFLNHLFFL